MLSEFLDEYLINVEAIKQIEDILVKNLPKKLKSKLEKYEEALLADMYFKKLLNGQDDSNLKSDVLKTIEIKEIDRQSRVVKYMFKNPTKRFNKYYNVEESRKELQKAYCTIKTMHGNVLMSTIVSFEKALSSMLIAIIEKCPDVYLKDCQVNFAEIIKAEDIEVIKENIITKKADELMRESIFTIIKLLNEKHKLGIGYDNGYVKDFIEAYLRRNIVVHNNGKINSDYINGMKKIGVDIDESKIGEEFINKKEYIDNIVDASIYTTILILYKIISKLFKEEKVEFVDKLMDIGFEKIKEGQYKFAKELFALIKDDSDCDEILKIYAMINYWQSFKWDGKYDEIKSEVESFDASACKNIIKLAVFALQDKYKEIELILHSEFNDITQNEELAISLEEFPVFQKVRQQKFYKKLKAMYGEIFGNKKSQMDDDDREEIDELIEKKSGKWSIKISI